ncbi:MAG: hypothetical protein ACFCUO_07185 [Rhodospirillales bacterium]
MSYRDLLFLTRFSVGSDRVLKHLLALRPAAAGRIPNRERTMTPQMDVCIEGFPYSANTFMTRVFEAWNPGVRLAHHVHVPLQLILAAEYELPALALIREPADAVTSMLDKDERLSPAAALWVYERFYTRLRPVADALVFAPFDTVTRAPDRVLERINAKYGKRFAFRRYDAAEQERLFARIDDAKVPKVPRSEAELARRQRIRERIVADRRYPRCRHLYETIADGLA